MRAEVIAIGDELTSGARLDTNSRWLSAELGVLGIPVVFHTTAADTLEAGVEAFTIAARRADVVVATGGLGPTADDLTRDVHIEAGQFAPQSRLDPQPHLLPDLRGSHRQRGDDARHRERQHPAHERPEHVGERFHVRDRRGCPPGNPRGGRESTNAGPTGQAAEKAAFGRSATSPRARRAG